MKVNQLPDGNKRTARWRVFWLFAVFAALLALAAAWSWSPLREWLDIGRIVAALEQLGRSFGPVAASLGFAAALVVAVPLTFLTLVTLVAFGAAKGFVVTIAGAALGAAVTFLVGKFLGHEVVQKLGGAKVNLISERLAKNGVLAVIAVRMVPIAPFAVVNMIAGATHLRLRDMLIGTVVGMTPGTLVMVLFIDQIIAAIKQPSPATAVLAVSMAVLILGGIYGLRRWLAQGDR